MEPVVITVEVRIVLSVPSPKPEDDAHESPEVVPAGRWKILDLTGNGK